MMTMRIPSVDAMSGGVARVASLSLEGIGCVNCAVRISEALTTVPHVVNSWVDPDSGALEVLFDDVGVRLADLSEIIAGAAETA
jgi:copper chaperone CopZ